MAPRKKKVAGTKVKAFDIIDWGLECQCRDCEDNRKADLYIPFFQPAFISYACARKLGLDLSITKRKLAKKKSRDPKPKAP
jgi:hypothetical protein